MSELFDFIKVVGKFTSQFTFKKIYEFVSVQALCVFLIRPVETFEFLNAALYSVMF